MSESNSIVSPGNYPASLPYKDRYGGLVVFGIFTVIAGGLCGLLVPLMFLGQAINAHNPNASPASTAMLLPVLLIYGELAVALVWLGIGSIKARRWARALLLIFSWSWLVMGFVTEGFMAVTMPRMLASANGNLQAGQPVISPAAAGTITFIMCLFIGFLFILVPAVWIFFYGSPNVKATCEARDPMTRWTDACPLPVLAISLWFWFAMPLFLLMPVSYHGVVPFFGTFLTGAPGDLFYLVLAVIWAWAGWRLYRLDVRAWWVLVAAFVLLVVSYVLTYSHHDILEMYRLMGYSEAQIEQIQKTGMLTGNTMAWMTGGFTVPFLGYLVFVKRYLRR